MSTMRVAATLTIEIDPELWREEYGDPTLTLAEIREAVRSAIVTAAETPGIIAPGEIVIAATCRESVR